MGSSCSKEKKNDYTSGSSRWVSNELNNQFMISFHLIHQFIEENQIYHESLGTLMDGIYLGTFDPDIIRKEQVPDLTEAKSPIKKLRYGLFQVTFNHLKHHHHCWQSIHPKLHLKTLNRTFQICTSNINHNQPSNRH